MDNISPAETRKTRVAIPGTEAFVQYTRSAADGALLRMAVGDRVYLEAGCDGWVRLDQGLGRIRERWRDTGLLREVRTPDADWQEVYGFDEQGRPCEVDGVAIHRDAQGRITACLGDASLPDHRWFYAYGAEGLVSVTTPQATRHLSRLSDGRVLACLEDGRAERFDHDRQGKRRGFAGLRDMTHHRDKAGRIWTVTDPAGAVRATYLWDGWRCLGRIDGAPGGPLAAFFCLDPSATPVRAITPDGMIRIPRDAYAEGLCAHPGVPGLFGAFQAGGLHHLPFRALDPRLGCFTAPDPFDGSETDPRRGPGGAYEGDLPIETDRQRPYEICRNDPVGRADPSGGISVGLLISSLTWSFQNNLVSFFGIDWWFNLFMSMFTGSNFFSSEGLVASDHIGAFGVRRDGFIPVLTNARAFTTQHIVWDTAESFDVLNAGMVFDPMGRFDPPLRGGILHAAPTGRRPVLLRAAPDGLSLNWNRNGGKAEPAFPGGSQPVFPSGGFHLSSGLEDVRGPVACPLTELVPGAGLTTGIADPTAVRQVFTANESAIPLANLPQMSNGEPVLVQDGTNRLRSTLLSFLRSGLTTTGGGTVTMQMTDPVPDAIGPTGISVTRLLIPPSSETAQDPGAGVQGLSARGLTQRYGATDVLEIRSAAGGADVAICFATGAEARLPLNAPAPAAMVPPINVIETTLAPPVPVTIDGSDGIVFANSGAAPAAGSIGLASNGAIHIPLRITDAAATPILRTDADLSALGGPGSAVTFQLVNASGSLGRRSDAVEAAAQITYVPATPGSAPDGSAGPVVVLLSAGGVPDAPRLVTGAPNHDAILTDVPVSAGPAPWTVQRWRQAPAPATIGNVSTTETIAITPSDPAQLAGALAIRVLSLAGAGNVPTPAATAAIAGIAMNGAQATFPAPLTSMPATPRIGSVIALRQGSTDSLASLSGLRVEFGFDRPVAIVPDTENFIVRLRRAGFRWTAERRNLLTLVLTPMASGIRSQFPRIRTGAAICLDWAVGGTPDTQIYRVADVEGLTLTLEGVTPIPANTDAGTLTAQLLEADDPGTGHQRIAIGLSAATTAPTRSASADVWSPDAFAATANAGGALGFGLVSGGITTPVVIDPGTMTLTLTFSADPGLTGNADVHLLSELQRFELPVTAALTEPLLLVNSTTDLAVTVMQPLVPSSESAPLAILHPGTVLVPEEEGVENTRRQALVDHELTHTEQYHKFGPIWFCYFPLFLTELPVELATDLDQPDFGPSVPAVLERVGARVRITPQTSLDVDAGDSVQLLQGGDHERMKVASLEGTALVMQGASALRPGALQVRKVHDDGIWSEVLLSMGRVTTHGGLLNTAVGFTWGGLLWLLAKGIYGAVRAIGGAGDQYPGTIAAEGREVELTDEAGRRELNADGQFILKSGDDAVLRSARRSGDRLVLDQPVALTGEVKVSAYASLDPGATFDWLQYRPGSIAADNPAAIDLPGHGSSFSRGDRVEYIYLGTSGRSHVSAVNGDRIELEEIIRLQGSERSIRVAPLAAAGTTLANADEAALNWMGMGWMRILFDPYGQIEARVGARETWAVVLLRVMRVLLGSRNWSAMIPFLGYVFQARLLTFLPWTPPEHRAKIEQQASEKSGDLYSPLARLLGEVRSEDRFGETGMAVGDIARYRYWEWSGVRDLSSIGATQEGSDLGAPGLHVDNRDLMRVIVNRITGTTENIPNRFITTDQTGSYPPATALPDLFFRKNFDATLGALTDPADIGLLPADLGAVPLSPRLVRNPSIYVAFCRPGQHRVTLANNAAIATLEDGLEAGDDVSEALDAQDHERQTLLFDVTALDVEVKVNGAPVAEGDTVTLLQTQTVLIDVATTGPVPVVARRFRASIASPRTGVVLRAPAALRLVAQGVNSVTPEPIEISRFYDFDETSGTYSDPVLAAYGLHLGGDLDIPVRSFAITVTDQLTALAAADPAAATVTSLRQGDSAFLLIPTSADEVNSYRINGAASTAADPALQFETVATPDAAAASIGSLGHVRRIRFAPDPPLGAAAAVEISVPVHGEDGGTGLLHLALTVEPPAP